MKEGAPEMYPKPGTYTWRVCPACSGVGHTLHGCGGRYLRPGGLPPEEPERVVRHQGDLFYESPYHRANGDHAGGSRDREAAPSRDYEALLEAAIQEILAEAGL